MDKQDEELMTRHGITAETKTLYRYDGHRYERLADAVNYARTRKAPPKGSSVPPGSDDEH